MEKKLYKSINNKMLIGVCGGISEYFGFNVMAIRVLWVLGTLLTWNALFLYTALVILMPAREWKIIQGVR